MLVRYEISLDGSANRRVVFDFDALNFAEALQKRRRSRSRLWWWLSEPGKLLRHIDRELRKGTAHFSLADTSAKWGHVLAIYIQDLLDTGRAVGVECPNCTIRYSGADLDVKSWSCYRDPMAAAGTFVARCPEGHTLFEHSWVA